MQIFHFSLYSQFFLEQINDFGKTGEIWMEFEMSSGLREETYWVRQIKSRHKKEGVKNICFENAVSVKFHNKMP